MALPEISALRSRMEREPYDSARTSAALRVAARSLLGANATLHAELVASTGLSLPMVQWGLTTSLDAILQAPLEALVQTNVPPSPKPELIGVVLAGNIFSACLRALSLPLLAGAHVLAKTASAEGVLARAWQKALLAADSGIGARLSVLQFPRSDTAATRALCESVAALSVYGDDTTIADFAQLTAAGCRLIPHGHGVSAAYITEHALRDESSARAAAERLALDIAAYDQRGCLSPQFVCVQTGAQVSPDAFAQLLADYALPRVAQRLPLGTLTLEERAARMQWQAAAAVRGELYAHEAHAVSFEDTLPARPSPGGRLVTVHATENLAAVQRTLEPFARHLKCLGIAGTTASLDTWLASFSEAALCPCGEMQTPAFDAWADGRAPFAGLIS
ncbi:MAG: hypothetical protein RL701_7311 [Pseudomonadota bacterium]